jgi:hypothetical protein
MPSAQRSTTPVGIDLDFIEGRYAELGDYMVSFESFKKTSTLRPTSAAYPMTAAVASTSAM